MNTINLEILINNILKVLLFLIIFGIIILISIKGLNTVFVKTKEGIDNTKSSLNNKLSNLNIGINPKLFDFLVKIQNIFKNKYIVVFIISIVLITLWFFVFYKLVNNYFNDSEVMEYKGTNYNIKHLFGSIYSNFGSFALPKKIYYINELPKTRSGKILRRLLRSILLDPHSKQYNDLTMVMNKKVLIDIKEKILNDIKN